MRHTGGVSGHMPLSEYVFSRNLLNILDAFLQFTLGAHYQIHMHTFPARALLVATAAVYFILAVAFISGSKNWLGSYKKRLFLCAVLCMTILPFFTVPFAGALYIPKYLLPFTPLFFLIIAKLAYDMPSPVLRVSALTVLFAILCSSTTYYYRVLGPSPSFKDAIRFVAKEASTDDTIVVSPGYYYMLFDIYGPVQGKIMSVPQGDFRKDIRKQKELITPETMERFARENLTGKEHLWVFYGDGTGERERIPMDPYKTTYSWFESHYKAVPSKDFRFYISTIKPGHGKPLGLLRFYVPR